MSNYPNCDHKAFDARTKGCAYCGKHLTEKEVLVRTPPIDLKKIMFTCFECNVTFDSRQLVKEHINLEHDQTWQ